MGLSRGTGLVEHEAARIRYESVGARPAVVLAHGLAGNGVVGASLEEHR